jgi:hypothetical protein
MGEIVVPVSGGERSRGRGSGANVQRANAALWG